MVIGSGIKIDLEEIIDRVHERYFWTDLTKCFDELL